MKITASAFWSRFVPILAAILGCASGAVAASTSYKLRLPKNPPTTASWIVSPGPKGASRSRAPWRLAVDASGLPLLGRTDGLILRPHRRTAWKLARPFNDLAIWGETSMIFCTAADLGLIPSAGVLSRDKKGYAILPFQPITALPVRDCRLSANGNDLYVRGKGRDSKRYQVYRLRLSHGDAARPRPAWELLYSSKEPITAVTGHGDTLYIATGELIVEIKKGGKPTGFFLHPSEKISDLTYAGGVGLFYATPGGVGFAGPKTRLHFLDAKRTQIAARNGSLYVLFADNLGVMEISGLSGFARLGGKARR